MVKVRAVFEKKGRAKYISHLDLNRCIQRTIKRSVCRYGIRKALIPIFILCLHFLFRLAMKAPLK